MPRSPVRPTPRATTPDPGRPRRAWRRRAAFAAAALVTLVLAPAGAGATPLVEPHVGGFSFVGPTSPHVTAIFWNPAAAGLMHGDHLYLSGALRIDSTSVQRATISTANGEPDPAGDRAFPEVDARTLTPGGFVGFVSDLRSDRITMGVAAYLPYAEELPEAEPLAYHARGGSFYASTSTLSTSFRATQSVYLGFGLSVILSELDLRFLRDARLDECPAPPCGVEDPAFAEAYRLQTTSMQPAISFNVGGLVKIRDWWVGAAFISPASSFGRSDIPRDAAAEVDFADDRPTVTGTARVTFRLPTMVHVGARRPLAGGYDLVLGGRWIGLSAHRLWDVRLIGRDLREAEIPEWMLRYRGLQDVWSLEGGVENQPGSKLRLGARLRVETSAVPTSRVAPDQVDAPKAVLGGGAELRLTRGLALSVGYALSVLLPRDVDASVFTPSAQIACVGSGYDLAQCEAARVGRAIPTAAGRYTRFTNQLFVALAYDWW